MTKATITNTGDLKVAFAKAGPWTTIASGETASVALRQGQKMYLKPVAAA